MSAVADRNTRTVEAFYQAEIDSDLATWTNFWHPDAALSFWLNEMKEAIHGRDTLVELEAEKFDRIHRVQVLDGGHRRPARRRHDGPGTAADPPRSHSLVAFHYWLLFHFDDAGLIVELEEIADTRPPVGFGS